MAATDPIPVANPAVPPVNGRAAGRWAGSWPWAVAAIGAVALLGFVEPRGQFYFPRCALKAATGWSCPGCGGLRATHALLNGNLAAAWRLNALFVVFLPVFGWVGLVFVARRFGRRLPNPFAAPWMIGALLGVAFVFGVLRNLPPFAGR